MNGKRDDNASVALYWDFENLHAGLADAKFGEGFYAKADSRFKPQEPLVDIQAVVDLCSSYGPIAINRAYCNWQFYGRYRDALLQSAVELIQLFPPGASAKNGADIKLCLDAMEDAVRFDHIGIFVIIGGDSDFMPLAQKIKAAGKTLIGIGARKNTNRHWAKSCHAFRYYDSLESPSLPDSARSADDPDPTADLLRRALRMVSAATGESWLSPSTVWHMVQRLDPTFDTVEHGYRHFSDLLVALDHVVVVRHGLKGEEVSMRT